MSNTPIYNFIQNKDFFESLYKTNDIKFRYSNGVFKIARPMEDTMFSERLTNITGSNLSKVPWATGHMFLAGGSMNYVLDKSIAFHTIAKSDLDFFVLNDSKTKKIVNNIIEYLLTIDQNAWVGVTGGVITVWGSKFSRPIQIVIMDKVYKSIADIFNTFDMPHIKCAYDGLCLYTTPDALHSIRTKNTSNTTANGRNTNLRMYKALSRGYNISGVLHSTLAKDPLVKDYVNKSIYKITDMTNIATLEFEYPTMRHISPLAGYNVDPKTIENGVKIEDYIAQTLSENQSIKLDLAKTQKEVLEKALVRGLTFRVRSKGNTIVPNIIMEIPLDNCSWSNYNDKQYNRYVLAIKTNVLLDNKILSTLTAIFAQSFNKVEWKINTNISIPHGYKALLNSALEDIVDLGSIKVVPFANQATKQIFFRLYAPNVYGNSNAFKTHAYNHIDWNGLNDMGDYAYSGQICTICDKSKCFNGQCIAEEKVNIKPIPVIRKLFEEPKSIEEPQVNRCLCCPADNTKIKNIYIDKYLPKVSKLNQLEVFRDLFGPFGYRPLETNVIIPIEPYPETNVAKGYNMYGDLFYKVHDNHADVYYYGFHISENTRNMLYAYIIDQFNLRVLSNNTTDGFKYSENQIGYVSIKGQKRSILVKHNIMMLPGEEHKIPVGSNKTLTLIPFINEKPNSLDNFTHLEINFRVAK